MFAATFIVRDGRVANLRAHLERLREQSAVTEAAISAALLKIRDAGEGVFRAKLQVSGHTLAVDVRPAILPPDEAIVNGEGIRDARRRPTLKGPDFGWQQQQLQQVRRKGAEAGLLIDDAGYVISGIFSAVIYVHDSFVHVSAHPRAAASITLDAALELLEDAGVAIIEHPEGLMMQQLRTHETWLLSSTEGIRKVTGWMEYGSILPQPNSHASRQGVPTHTEIAELMWARAEEV